MNYDQSDFFDLMDAVDDQGGDHLDELCSARRYEFPGGRPVTLPGCGQNSIFRVPFEGIVAKDGEVEPGIYPVIVCGVDDDLGAWPRFGGDTRARRLDKGEEKVELFKDDPRVMGK